MVSTYCICNLIAKLFNVSTQSFNQRNHFQVATTLRIAIQLPDKCTSSTSPDGTMSNAIGSFRHLCCHQAFTTGSGPGLLLINPRFNLLNFAIQEIGDYCSNQHKSR